MFDLICSRKILIFAVVFSMAFFGTAFGGDISKLKVLNIGLGDSLKTAKGELDNTKLLKSGFDSISGHKVTFSKVTNDSFISLASHEGKIYEIRFLVKRKSDAEEEFIGLLRKADDDVFDFYNSNKNSDIEKGNVKLKVFEFSLHNQLASVEIFDTYSIFTFTDSRKASEIVKQVLKP